MIKIVTALSIFFVTTNAWAGLPPTTIQGQSDASAKTKFSFQVPYNQSTDLGGIKSLIETGNQNLLSNPSFENTSSASGWTVTTASGAKETSTIEAGKQSEKITYSTSTGDIAQSVTPSVQTLGQNIEASCAVNTTLSTIQVCALSGGTEIQCSNAPASGNFARTAVNIPGPSNGTSIGVRVKTSASTTGAVYVDDCYVGPSRLTALGYAVTDSKSFTSSISGSSSAPTKGTIVTDAAFYAQTGDKMSLNWAYSQTSTGGAAGSGTYLFTLPNGLAIDTSKQAVSSTLGLTSVGAATGKDSSGNQYTGYVAAYDSTHLAVVLFNPTAGGPAFWASTWLSMNSTIQIGISVPALPILGWTSSQSGYRADVTPASWSGFSSGVSWVTSSATFADFGLNTGTTAALTQRQNRNFGTVTTASSNLAGIIFTPPRTGNLFVCATIQGQQNTANKVAYYRMFDGTNTLSTGQVGSGGAGTQASVQLCGVENIATVASTTIKIQGATDSGGNSYIANLASSLVNPIEWSIVELDAPMPAPYLTGSVTSNSTTQGFHGDGATIATCSSSPCTISTQSGSWLSSVTRASTGDYTLNFVSGEFTTTPWCMFNVVAAGGNMCANQISPSTSSVRINTTTCSGSVITDSSFSVMCMGPH